MRLLTIQIDLDNMPNGSADIEPALNRALAHLRLRGIPLMDGIAHTIKTDTGRSLGYWSVQPRKLEKQE